MIKALIIEDELLARLGMRSLVDWESMGIVLLEDAADGREALDRIEKEKPDLILLDLNIPEIDGLGLLKIIRQRRLPIKTIVVSCYDDFDTVKEAMKLGAVDYIRKFGLSKEELTSSLMNITQFPAELPPQLTKSAVQSGRENREKLQNIPKEYEKGCLLSFYMLWKYSEEMTDLKIVETVVCQYYQKLGRSPMSLFYEGKLLVFLKEETHEEEVKGLQKMILHFVSNRCYIGITPYAYDRGDDKFFLNIANTIEIYGFYGGEQEIVSLPRPVEIQKTYPFDVLEYLKKLERSIAKISQEEIRELLEELFEKILGCRYLSVNQVKKLMIEILSLFSGKARALGGSIEEIEVQDSYRHYQKIANVTSFARLRRWWGEFVARFTSQFFTRQKRSESDIIQNALDYIEANLDKPIQLSDVARFIGVSEPYLSSFFKSSMNENFIPYVNRQKMKRAKQLFAEGKLVYQVSELLGYENTTYFSKVFKRVEGVTPEQYRKKLY